MSAEYIKLDERFIQLFAFHQETLWWLAVLDY